MHGYRSIKDMSQYNRWTKSYRYKTSKVEKDGKFYLFKKAVDVTHRRLLDNEKRWREFINHMNLDDVSSTTIAEQGDDYIVFDWTDAKPLADRSPSAMKGLEPFIQRFTKLLIDMDRLAIDFTPSTDDSKAQSDSSIEDYTIDFLLRKHEGVVSDKWLSEADVNLCYEIGMKHHRTLETRYQHSDFGPWHIFVEGEKWLIYDGEHANSHKARFQDVVHVYTRLATVCKRADLAKTVLRQFLYSIDDNSDTTTDQIMKILWMRSFGEMINAYNDKAVENYTKEAKELWTLVQKNDINALV